jgi:protein-disulfide isomerase
MKKVLVSLSLLAALSATSACQKDNQQSIDLQKQMLAKLDSIDQQLKKGGGMAGAGAPGAQPNRPRPAAPDPGKVYSVPIEGAATVGKPDALVTIIKGYEYACPYCEKSRPTVDEIQKAYGDKVRFVFKQFVVHPQVATDAALGICAATRQGKFEKMDEALWEKAFKARKFDRANIEAIGQEIGLDVNKMKADMDGSCKEVVAKDQADLSAVGTRGTPAWYINGRFISGAQPFENFKSVIDEELKKAQERVASGTKPDAYYKEWVLDKGAKKLDPAPPGPM